MTNWTKMGGGEMNPIWEPEEKDTIEGILREKKNMVGPNNSALYTIEDPKGKGTDVWGSTVLDNRLGKLPVGTLIRITYLGLAEGKRGKYKNYDVEYDADTMPQIGSTASIKEIEESFDLEGQ